jgi:hypothetical protein
MANREIGVPCPEHFCGIFGFCVNRGASRSVFMVKLHHRETKPISEGGSSLRLQVSSRTGGSSAQNEPNLPKSSMRNEPNFPRAESPGPADCAKRTQLGWSAGALKGEMCKTNPICRSQACETNPISPAPSRRSRPIVQNEPNWAGRPGP